MKMFKKYVLLTMTGLFMAFAGSVSASAVEDVPGPTGELKDFKLITLDNEERSTEIFEDRDVTLINIWGTYCGPCIQEMPELAEFAAELPDRVQFMTLCIDAVGQEEDVQTFLEKVGFEDPSKAIVDFGGDILDMLGQVMYVPTTITVDKDGKLLDAYLIGSAIDIKGTYTELANKALELQELPLLGEEEEACTEGLTE